MEQETIYLPDLSPTACQAFDGNSPETENSAESIELQNVRLERLAAEVKVLQGRIALAQSHVAKARGDTLSDALAAGKLIAAAKDRLPFGAYLPWLKLCGPGLSEDTAQRYIKLAANSAHVRNLKPGTSLNKAYRLLGIIKPATPKSPSEQVLSDLDRIKNTLSSVSSGVPEAQRMDLATLVRELGEACAQLALEMEYSVLLPGFQVKPKSGSPTGPEIECAMSEALMDLSIAGYFTP